MSRKTDDIDFSRVVERGRFSFDLGHAIETTANEEGRRAAIAFCHITKGIATTLQLTDEQRAKMDSFNSDAGLGEFAQPEVDIWAKKQPSGCQIMAEMVRSLSAAM